MNRLFRFISLLVIIGLLAACTPPATQAPTAEPPATVAVATTAAVQATAEQATAAPTAAPTQIIAPTATQAPTTPAKVTRPLVVLASDQPGSADPAENWTFGGAAYLPNVYDSLFRFEGESSPKLTALLASEVPTVDNLGISKDGLVYTIKMKSGTKFHDGSPVNADAVVYSYQRIEAVNKGANGITADWVAKVEKVDDLTVKFTLKQPFADFLNSMGSVWGNYIVNPVVCKANEKDKDWCYTYLLTADGGSGPYKMTQFDKANNQVTLERYADYWGGWTNPNPVEKVIIRWLADAAGARPLIEKGDADVAINLPTTDYEALQKNPGLVNEKHPSIMQYYLSLNGSAKPLDNVKVRQALQYSFNTDQVISDIFDGNLIKMSAAVGPGYPDVYPAKTQYPYDLDKAKALLKEAGFDKLTVTANLVSAMPNDSAVLEYWQADLAKIGVTLKIQQVDNGVWSKAWFDQCSAATAPNIGQITAMGVGGDYPSAWEVIAQVYPTPRMGGGKCSVDYINNPKLNDTFKKISDTTDLALRQTLFQDLYNTISEDAGIIWLGQGTDLVTLRDVVQGYQYYFSMGGNYLPLTKLSLTK
jgi:ABC-type transport system substrate-binding protein